MLSLIVLLLAVSLSLGQHQIAPLHNECHCNSLGIREDVVVNQVAHMVDVEKDGILHIGEIVVGLNRIFGGNLPMSEETLMGMDEPTLLAMADLFGVSVSKTDFVTGWVTMFHDCPTFVGAVFDAFDDDHSGALTMKELEGILEHVKRVTDDQDGIITVDEFRDFFMWIYSVC